MQLAILLLTACTLSAALVSDVRFKLSAGDLSSADALADEYYRAHGANSEYAAAVSWLARGAFVMKDPESAARYLAQLKSLTAELLKSSRPEDDPFLATAVGSSIETEALLIDAQGQRDKAVRLLESELPRWKMYALRAHPKDAQPPDTRRQARPRNGEVSRQASPLVPMGTVVRRLQSASSSRRADQGPIRAARPHGAGPHAPLRR